VGLLVDKVAPDKFVSEFFSFRLSLSFHRYSVFIAYHGRYVISAIE